ncbi:MAG: HYR domain-containing protein, partial [Anaerolineaceae bacterium]
MPTLVGMPENMVVEGNTVGGAIVTYTPPSAEDIVDANPTVGCSPASGSFFALGGPQTVTCTAEDDSGNERIDSFEITINDTTPPTISFVSQLPVANEHNWNNSNVTINWTCSDTVGVISPTVILTLIEEGANQSAIGTCVDTSGNTASDTRSAISIDKSAPSLVWNDGPVD